jgi:hypothetical protein
MVYCLSDRDQQRLNDYREEMKRVLVLVMSCQDAPYGAMLKTSQKTWDSISVPGVDTVFYCGEPVKEDTDNVIYFPVNESLHTLGEKTLLAYEWALKNREFDYIARVNASTYVNKKELIKYIQTLPDKNVFAGLEVEASETTEHWIWGPSFILSKDLIQLIVDNKSMWDHSIMDDLATSFLLNKFNIPYTPGRACSIEKKENGWLCFSYGSQSIEFTNFADLNKLDNQFFFRVKQDLNRSLDEVIMNKLFKALL